MLLILCYLVVHYVAGYACESVVQGGMLASGLKLVSVHGGVAPSLTFGSGTSEVRFRAKTTEGLVIETPTFTLMSFKPDNSIEIGAQNFIIKRCLLVTCTMMLIASYVFAVSPSQCIGYSRHVPSQWHCAMGFVSPGRFVLRSIYRLG